MIDYWRQLDVFSPEKWGNTAVHIVGCGATGSWVALSIAKMGVQNIHLWDCDIVESHNLPNQCFSLDDVEVSKVEALAQMIEKATGTKPTKHEEFVGATTNRKQFSGVVFLLVDSMSARKEIWERVIKLNPKISLMIETRMGFDSGMIYTINPTDSTDISEWEESLYTDEESTPSPCTRTTILPTALLLTSLACWSMLNWFINGEKETEIIVGTSPMMMITKQISFAS